MPRFSNWREDFVANESSNSMVLEVITDTKMTDKKDAKKVKEKNINNAKLIKINPTFKEAIEEIGGELLEVKEVDSEKAEDKEDSSAKQLKNKEKRAKEAGINFESLCFEILKSSGQKLALLSKISKIFSTDEL